VEELDPTHRYGAERVAVVSVGERDERGAPGLAALLPVLKRHLQRDLDGGRPGLRVEDPAESGGCDLDQSGGELGSPRMGESQHGRVSDPVELLAHGSVELRVTVPVNVAPQRGDAIDVAPPSRVDQVGALGFLDHHRLLLHPALLLGERVPDEALIELGNGLRHHRGRR
jgi:hypothetical protein